MTETGHRHRIGAVMAGGFYVGQNVREIARSGPVAELTGEVVGICACRFVRIRREKVRRYDPLLSPFIEEWWHPSTLSPIRSAAVR